MELKELQTFFALAPFIRDLGVEPTAVAAGAVTAEVQLAQRHLQHTGQAHAGVMATLADHAMGAAAQTMAQAGHWAITAELKTSQLRPAKGDKLVCEAVVIKAGRSISFTEAQVFAQTGDARTLVMKASATMALVKQ